MKPSQTYRPSLAPLIDFYERKIIKPTIPAKEKP
jgi:hypothetical protein